MSPSRAHVISLALLASISLSITPALSGQIIELRDYHGKQISCARSGLHGFAMPCGIETWYEDIFVGSVLSVRETEGSERALEITPEEIFYGNPPNALTVTTNQGDCLGDITTGDRWLFYLRRDSETKKLLLGYESPSGSVADKERTLSLLRRLTMMTNSGVIRGNVAHPVREADHSENWTYPPHHKVVAKQVKDGKEYVAFTDLKGDYEFEPLPAGSYDLSANTTQGLWAEEGRVDFKPRGCSSIGFALRPAGSISGRVTTASGQPAKYAPVAVAPVDGPRRWAFATADEQGYFEVNGLEAGRYLVGVEIEDNQGDLRPRGKAYYPGVRERDLAVAITLGQAESRTHIDFDLPRAGDP
jgi:hypothetical protein